MAIFNSLGSNYDFNFSWLALQQLLWPNLQSLKKLKQNLEKRFSGEVKLVWKGRDAIEFALASYGIGEGDVVATQAFTCVSIEEATQRVGAKIAYLDLPKEKIQLDVATFISQIKNIKKIKVVILQHTLGYVDEVEKIAAYCQENQILLIEDLAQSFGADYALEAEVGSLADAIILSFGRDKVVDGISGGAVVFKTKPKKDIKIPFAFPATADEVAENKQKKRLVFKDLFYPVLTFLIRKSYDLYLGKLLHLIAKKFNWFYSPVQSFHQHFLSLPAYYAPLVNYQLGLVDEQLEHRRKLAHFYYNRLQKNKKTQIPFDREAIKLGANLRFPLLVQNVDDLIKYFAKNKIYLVDRWYRQPVACGSLNCEHSYEKGSCPQAENLAKNIVNLPTHQETDLQKAEKIVQIIEQWTQER